MIALIFFCSDKLIMERKGCNKKAQQTNKLLLPAANLNFVLPVRHVRALTTLSPRQQIHVILKKSNIHYFCLSFIGLLVSLYPL